MKNAGKRLLFLPVWLMVILIAVSAVALVAVFTQELTDTLFAYLAYGLAFYTLCVITCFFAVALPKQYGQIKARIHTHPFGHRYMTDRAFRAKISLYLSLAISLLYVAINLWSWYIGRSWWFVVLAVYYGIMAVMRFLLVRYVGRNALGSSLLGEWRRSRVCACILLLINLCLSSAVLMILHRNRGYKYPGVLIYVMAFYAFYSTIHAIVEMVKYRAMGSPIMSTAKFVSLSAALVSILNLETAMFAAFGGDMPQESQNLMIILTGAGISATVITLSVILIVKATKEIRREKYGK